MRLVVKFVKALDVVSGETDRGRWCRGGMVVRTLDVREQLVAITAFGEENCRVCGSFKADDIITVLCLPESREYGEKWFTDLRMISANLLGSGWAPSWEKGGKDE